MKATINCFSDDLLLGRKNCSLLGVIGKELFKYGIFLESTTIKDNAQKSYSLNISEKNNHLFVLIVDDDLVKFNNLLNNLALTYDLEMKDNFNAKKIYRGKFSREVLANSDFKFPLDSQNFSFSNSKCFSVFFKVLSSYVLILPDSVTQDDLFVVFQSVKEKLCLKIVTETIKTFGITIDELKFKIGNELTKSSNGIGISISETGLICEINLRANIDKKQELLAETEKIYNLVKNYVFLFNDMSSESVVFRLLKDNNLTLSTAESITGGKLISDLISSNEGASHVIKEGVVCYSRFSKENKVGVKPETIDKYTAVSSEVAYEMAVNMLERTKCDIVLCTTGYASSCDKPENKGLCYIAIGDKQAVHIYKNFFLGTRKEIISQVCQACHYYLIKKLSKNDFTLLENNV